MPYSHPPPDSDMAKEPAASPSVFTPSQLVLPRMFSRGKSEESFHKCNYVQIYKNNWVNAYASKVANLLVSNVKDCIVVFGRAEADRF